MKGKQNAAWREFAILLGMVLLGVAVVALNYLLWKPLVLYSWQYWSKG